MLQLSLPTAETESRQSSLCMNRFSAFFLVPLRVYSSLHPSMNKSKRTWSLPFVLKVMLSFTISVLTGDFNMLEWKDEGLVE